MGQERPIRWDTGFWRNDCEIHMNPAGYEDPNLRKLDLLCISERRNHIMWGVVNPGNALVAGVFNTKREAEQYRRQYASVYVVVRVCVTPLYTHEPEKRAAEVAYCRGETNERPENGLWPNRFGHAETDDSQ